MFSRVIFFCLTALALCLFVACNSSNQPLTELPSIPSLPPDRVAPIPTQSSLGVSAKPIEASWSTGSNPIVSTDKTIFGAHVVVITDKQVTVVYSVSSDSSLKSIDAQAPKLTDNNGKQYKTTQPTALAELEGFQLVAVTFQSPETNASEFALEIQPGSEAVPLQITLAQIEPLDAQPPYIFEGRQTLVAREGYLDQGDYRVSFNGFFPYSEDVVAKQQNSKGLTTEELIADEKTKAATTPEIDLSKPFPTNAITDKVSEGKPRIGEATIRIENLKTGQVQFLFVVFLDDGDIKSTWLE